jgi:hypothetical protein
MTTLNGAEFLDATSTMGSVDVGKNADLVLLAANPIDDVANLHQISGVVRNGHHYSMADLSQIKERVRASHPARLWAAARPPIFSAWASFPSALITRNWIARAVASAARLRGVPAIPASLTA